MQGDDGYPNDQILLHEALAVLTFTNDTRLMQNIPCAYVWTPSDTSNRQKIGSNIYKFPYRPQKFVGCAGGPGDLFAVCGPLYHKPSQLAQQCVSSLVISARPYRLQADPRNVWYIEIYL